jgi:hypothetical protein
MSYINSLNQYRSLADAIRSGEYKPPAKQKAEEVKQGLVARPVRQDDQEVVERDSGEKPEDMMMNFAQYFEMLRRRNEEGADPGDGIDTQTVTTAQRPRSRDQGGYDAPVKGLMANAFQERLGLDLNAATTLSKAFLINFKDESGLIPDRVEEVPNVHGTRGKGYYQLTGPRREQFESIYGTDGYTDENQTEFLIKELIGSESRAGKEILAAAQTGNVGRTAAVIVDKFLRPAEKHKQERMARYLANYQ